MAQSKPGVRDYQNPKFEALDISFLNQGFYDKNNLRQELLDQEAKKLGQRFGPKGGFDKVSSAQIRRFFGDVRELENRLKSKVDFESEKPTEMEEHLAIVKMLKSKLAYSAGRGVISKSFSETLSKAIDQIKTPRDFKAFVLFFESIVGYYYGEGGGKIR